MIKIFFLLVPLLLSNLSLGAEGKSPQIPSSIGIDFTTGQNETGSLSLSGTIGFSDKWALDILGSGSRTGSNSRSREFSAGPRWRPAPHNEISGTLSVGTFSSPDGSFSGRRTGIDLGYQLELADILNWSQTSDLFIGAGSAVSVYDRDQTERETNLRLAWDQGISSFLRGGLSLQLFRYPETNRALSLRPFRPGSSGVSAGAPENAENLYLGFMPTDDDEIRLDLLRSKYVGEADPNWTSQLTWTHMHNEHWETRFFGARTVYADSHTYGLIGLGATHTF